MNTCLVTGGCGFIGSNLVHTLVDDGWQVEIVDDLSAGDLEFLGELDKRVVHVDMLSIFEHKFKEGLQEGELLVITGDFAHKNVLERIKQQKYDCVFHLAARPRVEVSVRDPVTTTEINLFKTVALFNACRDVVKRVVFSSSSSVYGDAQEFPTKEGHLKTPRSPYALQKLCGEQFARLFKSLYDQDIVSLRYFNVYGPRQYGDSPYATAISAWCDATKNKKELRSDGDGTQCRDLTYVDDVVSANLLAATTPNDVGGETFNIGYGEPHSNNEILELFQDRFENLKIKNAPWRPGDVKKTHADIGKAIDILGYASRTDIISGLEKTFEWWGLLRG